MKNEVKKSRHMETKIIDGYTVKIYVEECLPEELDMRRRSFAHLIMEMHRKVNEDTKNKNLELLTYR